MLIINLYLPAKTMDSSIRVNSLCRADSRYAFASYGGVVSFANTECVAMNSTNN